MNNSGILVVGKLTDVDVYQSPTNQKLYVTAYVETEVSARYGSSVQSVGMGNRDVTYSVEDLKPFIGKPVAINVKANARNDKVSFYNGILSNPAPAKG